MNEDSKKLCHLLKIVFLGGAGLRLPPDPAKDYDAMSLGSVQSTVLDSKDRAAGAGHSQMLDGGPGL
jgi:hypothetical protein